MKNIVAPFQGIFYNQDKIASLADVVSPPYDVIADDLQNELFERSPYNFCRLDLPKESGEARYEQAKSVFDQWQAEGVLVQDDKPSIYVHHHHFQLPSGERLVRKGFFAARRIEDFSEGGIKPHEKTLDGPKSDRLNMTRATKTNLSPVFSLYADPDKAVQGNFERMTQTTPIMDFVTTEGERHQVWRVSEEAALHSVNEFFQNTPLFIADGHHRYETALNYRNEIAQSEELDENAATRFLLMYFSNLNDEGMVVLPIHRALHSLDGVTVEDLLAKLKPLFDVQEVPFSDHDDRLAMLAKLGEEGRHAFWVVPKGSDKSYLISVSHDDWLATDCAKSLPESLAQLDVAVLHQYIFGDCLGLSEESQAKQENLIYWKSTEKALAETSSGRCDMTFILNPTKIEQVQLVADDGHKMPQKSTFFYPKILSGLVLHSVATDDRDGVA